MPGNATYCSASCFSLREEEIFWKLSCAVRGEQDAPELEGCPWQAAAGCCALFLVSGGCLGLRALVAESFQMLELLWALNPHSNKAKQLNIHDTSFSIVFASWTVMCCSGLQASPAYKAIARGLFAERGKDKCASLMLLAVLTMKQKPSVEAYLLKVRICKGQ
ncbi:hypothetical protein CIB84_011425 [Bambusicola thoracicus]|uniref:Uncharacterized protein n=1 Tax=Bambusicola thoracicus TaxID=9083 RepID=A0A2P4SL42_BAMTH|nr:hypothetical protein CIB84_011425 [Bambusicola thoracicus]